MFSLQTCLSRVQAALSGFAAGGRRLGRSSKKRRPLRLSLECLEPRAMLAAEVGMNLERIADFNPAWMFTDAFQSSRSWISYSYNTATGNTTMSAPGTAVRVDAHGWPTQLGQWRNEQGQLIQQRLGTMMYDAIDGHYPAGTYRAEWQGTGTIAWLGDARLAAQGTTNDGKHFALVSVSPTRAGIGLRIDGMSEADPIRNLHVWMPDYGGQSFAGQDWSPGAKFSPFHPLFRERLDPFATIRFMQAERTITSDEVHWSDRKSVDDARQSTFAADFQNGLAPEYMVELANELHSNAWFSMPYLADDDYIRHFATLVRDQLDPGLKVYVEWNDELWNYSPGYEAHAWVRDQVGLPPSDPNFWPTFYQIVARETKRDFDVWSEVFAGQKERLVRVVSGQAANSWVAGQILRNMDGHFDAVSCDGYVTFAQPQLAQFNASTTADQVVDALFQQALPNTFDFLRRHQALADQYTAALGRNIQLLVYEGGVLLPGNGRPYEQAFQAASRDPRMYDLYRQLLAGADRIGVDLFEAYVYTDTSPFGDASHLRYQDQPLSEAHKYRALLDAIDEFSQAPAPPAMNQAPVNTVPGVQRVAAGMPLIFSATNGNAISVADADAGTADVQVTVATNGGTLRLPQTTGLLSVRGDGTNNIAMVGSPAAINAALDGLAFHPQPWLRAPAVVRVTSDDLGNTGTGGAKSDCDDVAVTVVAPPKVQSVVLNDGGAQRSMVRSLTVNFDRAVRLDAGAFVLEWSGGAVMLSGYTPGVATSVTLTFSGERVEASGSLADGAYRLTVLAGRVHETQLGQELDGDCNGLAGGNRQDVFFRLFGDSDGDRDVDNADAALFDAAMGRRNGEAGYADYFDFNADGIIDALDDSEFMRRLLRRA